MSKVKPSVTKRDLKGDYYTRDNGILKVRNKSKKRNKQRQG